MFIFREHCGSIYTFSDVHHTWGLDASNVSWDE